LSAVQQIFGLPALRRGTEKRCFGDDFIADRNAETRAELAQLFFVQLLLLMRHVAAFSGFTQSVAFDRFGKYHGRLAGMLYGCLVSGINFPAVVASTQKFV